MLVDAIQGLATDSPIVSRVILTHKKVAAKNDYCETGRILSAVFDYSQSAISAADEPRFVFKEKGATFEHEAIVSANFYLIKRAG